MKKAVVAVLCGGAFIFASCAPSIVDSSTGVDSSAECDWQLTAIETSAETGTVELHSELQATYLADTYDSISKYASGTAELSRPEAVHFEWSATPQTEGAEVLQYILEISDQSDFFGSDHLLYNGEFV
jgi:hypothetical protein